MTGLALFLFIIDNKVCTVRHRYSTLYHLLAAGENKGTQLAMFIFLEDCENDFSVLAARNLALKNHASLT